MQSQNNFEINALPQAPAVTGKYLDMLQVPPWDGNSNHPFPRPTALIDFRGPDIGDFVFHCHILGHENLGMMNIIRVQLPAAANRASRQTRPVASDVKRGAPASSPPSAEVSPDSLEIADHVVEPSHAVIGTKQAGGAHHHH